MHNLKANFDKFLHIAKCHLKPLIYRNGNFKMYRNQPKFTDIEVVEFSFTAEALGIDPENILFQKLNTDYAGHFQKITHRCNFNDQQRGLPYNISILKTTDP